MASKTVTVETPKAPKNPDLPDKAYDTTPDIKRAPDPKPTGPVKK